MRTLFRFFGGVVGDGILDAGFGAIPVGADQLDLDVLQGKRLRRSRFSGDFHGDGLFRTVIEGHEDFFCGGAAGKTLVGGEVRVLEFAESFRERRPLRLTAFLI